MSLWNQIHNEYGLRDTFESILKSDGLAIWKTLSHDQKILFDWYKRHSA